jgi:hypothetical protein
MRVSCTRKSTLSTRSVKRDSIKMHVGITRCAREGSVRLCVRFLDREGYILFGRGGAMSRCRAARPRKGGSRRRRESGLAAKARRWGSRGARWWVPRGSTVRLRGLRCLGSRRTSSYTSSRTTLWRPSGAVGSASRRRSCGIKKKKGPGAWMRTRTRTLRADRLQQAGHSEGLRDGMRTDF